MLVDFPSNIYVWTALAVLVSAYLFRLTQITSPTFPIVNEYPGDLLGRRANRELRENARRLITEGLAKYQGPITVALPHGQKVILPASLAAWVKSNRDLDHKQLVKDDFFAGIPGFEAQTVLHGSHNLPGRLITTKLGPNDSTMETMNASLARGLQVLWGDDKEWHTIDWHKDTMGIIARAASSVFVGSEKADDPEWLDLVQGYVMSYFTAVSELHGFPAWSRSTVHWFLPNAVACRKYVARARVMIKEVLDKRQQETKSAKLIGRKVPEYNDALAWTQIASDGNIEPGDVQLSLAMAALFTTTEMFRQVLIEVACHPQLVEPLRSELSQQISAQGISVAAANNMVLLDSVMKESQRLSSSLGTCLHSLSLPAADFLIQWPSSVWRSETQSFLMEK